ncbi:MAG: hypothetical protein R3F59_20425 [Myxococcota bacterium]
MRHVLFGVFLVGCSGVAPDRRLTLPSDSAPTPSTADTAATAVALPCAEVTGGTGQVWLVSREDPSVVVPPAVPFDQQSDLPLDQLVGPDALGRLYLHQGDALLRSDDHGCSWAQVSTAPYFVRMLASAASERLYLSAGAELHASEDGGVTLTQVGVHPPQRLLGISDTELLAQTNDLSEIVSSTDGANWTSVTALPDEYLVASVDPVHLDHIVLRGDNDRVWTYDGTTWGFVDPTPALNYRMPAWNDGVLVVEARAGSDIGTSVLLRSETGSPPFVEVDWEPDVDDLPGLVWVDGEQIVVTGRWTPGEVSDATGPAEGLFVVTDGTNVDRHTVPDTEGVVGVGVFDDVFAIGLHGTSPLANDR